MTTSQPQSFRYPLQNWVVVLSSALFFFYEFIQMNMPNSMAIDLMQAFNINGFQLSNLSAAYFYADVALLLPAGFLLDRFSTRHLILVGVATCALGSLGFAMAHNYWLAFGMRLITGAGAAFTLLSSVRLASRWFPAKQLALVTGLIVTMAMLGGMVAQTPMSLLIGVIGWRHAVLCDSALGFTFLVIIFLVVRDFPATYSQQHQQNLSTLRQLGIRKAFRQVLRNPQNWIAGFYTSLLNLPIFIIGGLWGTTDLETVSHLSKTQASEVSSMIFMGTIIGSPIIGFLSDRLGVRRSPMIGFALVSLLLMCVVLWVPHLSYSVLLLLFLGLGLVTSAQILSYPLITESNSKTITSSAMSIASLIIMLGGAVFQPVVGWLLQLFWDGKMRQGHPLYSAHDFHLAFMVLPLAFVIALLISFGVRETFCRGLQEK